MTGEVNAYTMSLIIYPIITTGLLLYRAGRLGGASLADPCRSPWTDLLPAGQRFGSQPPWLDLVLAGRQLFGSQLAVDPRCRSCPAADRVILQLEPLAGDFNELPSVVGPEPADVIEAAGKHRVVEIEAATNHLVWHQHNFVVIDDLPVAMTLYP